MRPGQFVSVSRAAPSRHAGRSGLLVAVENGAGIVRFGGGVRTYTFALEHLTVLLDAVRT